VRQVPALQVDQAGWDRGRWVGPEPETVCRGQRQAGVHPGSARLDEAASAAALAVALDRVSVAQQAVQRAVPRAADVHQQAGVARSGRPESDRRDAVPLAWAELALLALPRGMSGMYRLPEQ
jgi:hypothetical protein